MASLGSCSFLLGSCCTRLVMLGKLHLFQQVLYASRIPTPAAFVSHHGDSNWRPHHRPSAAGQRSQDCIEVSLGKLEENISMQTTILTIRIYSNCSDCLVQKGRKGYVKREALPGIPMLGIPIPIAGMPPIPIVGMPMFMGIAPLPPRMPPICPPLIIPPPRLLKPP